MASDLFRQINNAVLDLQGASLQTYEHCLRRLGRLLEHAELADANRRLTENLNLQSFLDEAGNTGGGFAGSHTLPWPDDSEHQLGLALLLLLKFADDTRFATSFSHTYYGAGNSKIMAGIQGMTRQLVVPFIRDYREYVASGGRAEPARIREKSNRVFIVHGHDAEARETVARFLSTLGLQPVILHEQPSRGRTIIEKVEAHSDVGFAVVLLTPDDEGRAKGIENWQPRARQNVLLELGYFMARLGRENVCALTRGAVDIPSDFAGVVWTAIDSSGGWRLALSKELQAAGYAIDWNYVMGGSVGSR